MENNTFSTEESTQNELINKRIHRAKLILDLLLYGAIAFVLLFGVSRFARDGLEGLKEFCNEKSFAVLLLPLIVTCAGCAGTSAYLDNCYRQYRCKTCGHIHKPDFVTLVNSSDGLLPCPNCNKTTKHKKVPFNDEKVNSVVTEAKNVLKKPWAILLLCLCAILYILTCCDPIVLDIKIDEDASKVSENGGVFTYPGYDRDVRWYLTEYSDPSSDITVIYLNRESEDLCEAMREGHVTTDDLDRFGIEYGIVPQD